MYCVFLGRAIQTVNPPNASVGSAQVADSLISGKTALGATPADTDELLISDAGTLKRVDFSHLKVANTPAFEAFLTTNQSVSEDTQTKVQCNSEVFDTAGAYDNSSNYRFTPQVAGKYYVYGAVNMNCNAVSSLKFCYLFTKKNGSDTIHYSQSDHRDNYAGYNLTVEVGGVIDMNGSSDYVELWGLISTNNSTEEFAGASSSRRSYFGAYKIIE
jgi:hypothetical protein